MVREIVKEIVKGLSWYPYPNPTDARPAKSETPQMYKILNMWIKCIFTTRDSQICDWLVEFTSSWLAVREGLLYLSSSLVLSISCGGSTSSTNNPRNKEINEENQVYKQSRSVTKFGAKRSFSLSVGERWVIYRSLTWGSILDSPYLVVF